MSQTPVEQSQQDPSEEEKSKADKAEELRKVAAIRSEESRRAEVNDVMKLHAILSKKISEAVSALEAASSMSEGIQKHLRQRSTIVGSTESDREAVRVMRQKLDRMLRMSEVVRTVNTARMHVTRIHKGSAAIGRAAREWTDELVRSDSRSTFE